VALSSGRRCNDPENSGQARFVLVLSDAKTDVCSDVQHILNIAQSVRDKGWLSS